MKKKYTVILLTAAFACGTASAKESTKDTPVAVTTITAEEIDQSKMDMSQVVPAASDQFKWGGDIRLREVYFDNIPTQGGGEVRGGANHFQRYRTRIFGEYHHSDSLYVRGRVVNEFRTGQAGSSENGWEPMDETIFDNLFIDWKTDLWDIRLGRQDLIYGTGKVILDGTPLDGSRTIYFDAAKASFKGIDDTTVDFLAMYTSAQDPIAIHSQDRDVVGRGGSGYTGAEAGGGIYIKNKTYEDLPWEAYFITKTKEDDINNPGNTITDPINTFGTRLMPKWADGTFDSNLEMAYQSTPEEDGYMIDALVNWNIGEEKKSKLGLGWYHLSEHWNPIFARWPQYSELYVYGQAGAAGRWSNLSMPHIDFSISPTKKYTADFVLGYMFAPEDNGPGTGHNKGFLFTWWNKMVLAEKMFSEKDKLTGHILIELMEPGNYYTDAQRDEDIACFLRAELSYAF